MRRHLPLLALAGSACLLATLHAGAQKPQNAIAGGAEIRQGIRVSAVRAQQENLFVNPGAGVEQGQVLWRRPKLSTHVAKRKRSVS